MRTFEEIMAGGRPEPAFSNHTEWELWSYNWCDRCRNDSPEMVDRGEGCPIILAALCQVTPSEWLEQSGPSVDRYHCVEFRDREDPGPPPEPQPIPDPPGQLTLLPREPYEAVRMFEGVSRELVPS